MQLKQRIKRLEENQNNTGSCLCSENKKAVECHSFIDGDNGVILGKPVADYCQNCGKPIDKTIIQLID